jgi:spore germination protein GerM
MTRKAKRLFLTALFLLTLAAGAQALATQSRGREVKVFLIAIDDGGKAGRNVGCNDSVVAVRRVVPRAGAPLRAALEELLRLPARSGPGGQMHNTLHQPRLKLGRVFVRRGEAVIHLDGQMVTGGTCDAPRVQAQLEETARQFPSVRRVKVYVNGTPLADYLSERG